MYPLRIVVIQGLKPHHIQIFCVISLMPVQSSFRSPVRSSDIVLSLQGNKDSVRRIINPCKPPPTVAMSAQSLKLSLSNVRPDLGSDTVLRQAMSKAMSVLEPDSGSTAVGSQALDFAT